MIAQEIGVDEGEYMEASRVVKGRQRKEKVIACLALHHSEASKAGRAALGVYVVISSKATAATTGNIYFIIACSVKDTRDVFKPMSMRKRMKYGPNVLYDGLQVQSPQPCTPKQ